MAEIKPEGYQSLRDYIQANWQYIELLNDTGTAVLRLSPSDSRVTWTNATGDQTLTLQVVIQGSDTDITYPVTLASSAIYDVATGGNPYSVEAFSPFTIQGNNDMLTVNHSIEIPKVI